MDVTTGAVLGPHHDGEICIKAPTVMKGKIALTSFLSKDSSDPPLQDEISRL